MNLGENIYRLRTEKNMSQSDLANALDVSRQSVSKWENNSATPELDKLLKMSELFGVSLDELVTGTCNATLPSQPQMTPRRLLGIITLTLALLTLITAILFENALGLHTDESLHTVMFLVLLGILFLQFHNDRAFRICKYSYLSGFILTLILYFIHRHTFSLLFSFLDMATLALWAYIRRVEKVQRDDN